MYIVILNPLAGHGSSLEKQAEIEAVLKENNLEYRLEYEHETENTRHIARACAEENPEGIIAVGGDGTLFEIINGIAGSSVPLLFVPCGTGNDFVHALNLPKDPVEALRVQLKTPKTRIDACRMNDSFFLNVSGTGFDVEVLRYADKYKKKYSGLKPYLLALKDAFKNYKPMTAMVSFDDGPEEKKSFAILSVGNGRYIGGGMKAVPDAILNDGLFDVVIVKPVKRFMIPILLIFFIKGKHTALKLATMRRCKKLRIRRDGSTFNLDGELLDANEARYEIMAGGLCVQVPGL